MQRKNLRKKMAKDTWNRINSTESVPFITPELLIIAIHAARTRRLGATALNEVGISATGFAHEDRKVSIIAAYAASISQMSGTLHTLMMEEPDARE